MADIVTDITETIDEWAKRHDIAVAKGEMEELANNIYILYIEED
jgi:hypothetical protein